MACSGSTGLLESVANRPRNNPFFQELGTAARGLMRVRVLVCKVRCPGEFFNALITLPRRLEIRQFSPRACACAMRVESLDI